MDKLIFLNKFKTQGFTLIEILVVIAILAIASLLTVPPITKWISEKKITESTNKMTQILHYAREQSISSGLIYKIEYKNEEPGISAQTFVEEYSSGELTCPTNNWVIDNEQPNKILISKEKNIEIWTCNNSDICNKNQNNLCFFPHGGSTHKIIQIKDQSDRETHKRKIQTYSPTGFIEIFRRKDNNWVN